MAADFTQTRIDMLRRRWQETASPHVSLQLADLYRQQGSLTDAVEVLEGGLVDNPESVSLRVALGRYRMEAGDARGAADTLRAVVEDDPSHLVANKLLVKAYVLLGERQRARDRLDLYSLLNDSDPEIDVLEKSVAAGRPLFDSPRPAGEASAARQVERPAAGRGAPFDLPAAASGPAPDLSRVPRRPVSRRVDDGRTLWTAAGLPFPGVGAELGDPDDWSLLAAGGLFQAPPAVRRADGLPAAVPQGPPSVEERARRRREDHVEIRLRSRESPAVERPAEGPPPAFAPPESPGGEGLEPEPVGAEGAAPEAPVDEPPAAEPEIEEPEAEEPAVEEPGEEPPPREEPGEEEEISLAEVLEADEEPGPTLTLARLYLDQGHLDEAEEAFRAIMIREPGNEEARRGLAEAVERRYGPAAPEAAEAVEEATGEEPEAPVAAAAEEATELAEPVPGAMEAAEAPETVEPSAERSEAAGAERLADAETFEAGGPEVPETEEAVQSLPAAEGGGVEAPEAVEPAALDAEEPLGPVEPVGVEAAEAEAAGEDGGEGMQATVEAGEIGTEEAAEPVGPGVASVAAEGVAETGPAAEESEAEELGWPSVSAAAEAEPQVSAGPEAAMGEAGAVGTAGTAEAAGPGADADGSIRRRIGALRKYLDGLRAARSAEGR